MNRLTFVALLGLASACYSYQPARVAPKVGERIHIALSPEGAVEMTRVLGPGVILAEGVVASVAADQALTVAVDFVGLRDGTKQPWNGEGVVRFPPNYVDGMRERRFERRRTIVATTTAVGFLIATAILAMKQAGADGGPGDGGTPPPQ